MLPEAGDRAPAPFSIYISSTIVHHVYLQINCVMLILLLSSLWLARAITSDSQVLRDWPMAVEHDRSHPRLWYALEFFRGGKLSLIGLAKPLYDRETD